LLRVLLT